MSEIHKTKKIVEAGEIQVADHDVINPSKLIMLGEAGWSISSAWNRKEGGFNLLLTRDPVTPISGVHEGTPRCPNYCNCLTRNYTSYD